MAALGDLECPWEAGSLERRERLRGGGTLWEERRSRIGPSGSVGRSSRISWARVSLIEATPSRSSRSPRATG